MFVMYNSKKHEERTDGKYKNSFFVECASKYLIIKENFSTNKTCIPSVVYIVYVEDKLL